jgi:hypothetical protein
MAKSVRKIKRNTDFKQVNDQSKRQRQKFFPLNQDKKEMLKKLKQEFLQKKEIKNG